MEQQENRDWLDHVGVPLTRHERMALLLLKRHGDMTVPQLHVALYLDSDDIRVILHRLVQARLADEIGPDRYALAEKVDGEEPSGAVRVLRHRNPRYCPYCRRISHLMSTKSAVARGRAFLRRARR